jgi:hypothetical protein
MSIPILMPRHEIWRHQYRQSRYARHLSQVELDARIRDILLNQLVLTAEGKVALIGIDESTQHWPEVWTHVLEEMRLRHGSYPAGFSRDILHSEPFPDLVGELARKAAKAMATASSQGTRTLVKFGKRTHMEALFSHGAARIQPASYFAAPEHNGAVRDNELHVKWSVVLSRADIVSLVRNPQEVPLHVGSQRLDVEFRAPGDYCLYCVAASAQPRLFVDFTADACVVIRDPAAFGQRLQRASALALPGTAYSEGDVAYLDPLRPTSSRVFVPSAKHLRYSYQREYRYIWIPNSQAQLLRHVDVEVGAIDDIAQLIVL